MMREIRDEWKCGLLDLRLTIGPNNVVVTLDLPGGTGILGAVVGAITFTGADQTSPLRPFVSTDAAAGTVASLNVPSGVNEMVIDTLATEAIGQSPPLVRARLRSGTCSP